MKEVRLLGRVLDQLEEQIRVARSDTVGGLLLGRTGESLWIEKLLPCRNTAVGGAASSRFEIDPRVVTNVERSLEGKPMSILGIYHGSARAENDIAGRLEPSWIEEGPLWLFARSNGSGMRPPRILRRDAGLAGAEVAIEVIRPVVRSPVLCPE